MIRRQLIVISIFFCVTQSVAQTAIPSSIPKDTTYTVTSTYDKLARQYPSIKVVLTAPSKVVKEFHDEVYLTLDNSPYGKRDLHADVFVPNLKKRMYPAIVMVHGGGWRSGDKSMNTPMARRLAANGIAVVSVEYRLSLEAKYPAAIHDLKAVIRWMRKNAPRFNIDVDQIAIAGCSAGGQLAALIGTTNNNMAFEGTQETKYSSAVQAVIDMDGLLDFTDPESLAVKRTDYSADVFWLEGYYNDIPQRWREASALTWVSDKVPPFLFINSSQTRFHAGCSTMVERLTAYKVYHEVKELDGSPHSYWFFDPWFEPSLKYITEFLNKVFK